MPFFNNLLVLILGIIISHLITSIILAIYYSQAFTIFSPIYLVKIYLNHLSKFKPISTDIKIWFWFYLIVSTIPLCIYQYLVNEASKGEYGYADFTISRRAIKKMGFNFDDGIIFGRFKNNILRRLITGRKYDVIKSNEPLSTLMIAPTGTGKTAGFIIPTLRSIKNSVVVFDIKGELYQNPPLNIP